MISTMICNYKASRNIFCFNPVRCGKSELEIVLQSGAWWGEQEWSGGGKFRRRRQLVTWNLRRLPTRAREYSPITYSLSDLCSLMRSLFQNISHSLSHYTPHKVLQSQLTNPLGALLRNFFQGLVPWVWGLSLGTCFHFSPVSWSQIEVRLFLLRETWFRAWTYASNVLAIILALRTRFNRQRDR